MRNCIILGSGRSGTSMVAGLMAKSGYYMGDNLYKARESNPKGFFESPSINGINEDLLAGVLPGRPAILGWWWYKDRPLRRQLWLARVSLDTEMHCPPKTRTRIGKQVQRQPFCFKDPRFCYTLPAWRPYLNDTAYVCVFRDPAVTAASILKECQRSAYLHSLTMTFDVALEVWFLMYQHVLGKHAKNGDWLFVHYNQVLGGQGIDDLEKHVGGPLDRSFPESKLRRSTSSASVPGDVRGLYLELCRRSGYDDP